VEKPAAKAPAQRATAKTVESKPAKPSAKANNPVRAEAAAAKSRKSAPPKTDVAERAARKESSRRSAPQTAKKPEQPAGKAVKAAKEPKKPSEKAKPGPEPKLSKAPAKAPPAPEAPKAAAAPAPEKKVRRAPAPALVRAPPAAPPPGRIVAKGVPMAPEPRSPAIEKQRMKDALAARELATKQESFYEKAVAQFNRRKFARALPLFEQAAEGPQVALSDRARVYAQICRQRTEENKIQLRNAEDYYNYGVKLLNDRELEDASAHLSEALRRNPKAAHAHYATAVLHALNRNNAGVYESLKKAIELDPRNRHLALRDSDLSAARRDPAIFNLLHSNVFAPPAS
jgi:tetratricopeptide (TPR) repeat protein